MWFWGNGVLVSDGAWLMFYDLAKGVQKFLIARRIWRPQPSAAAGRSIRVTGIALNPTTAFIGVGSAILAINRAGKVVTTMQVGNRLAQTPETPTAASASWVDDAERSACSRRDLYRVGSRTRHGSH